MSLQRLFSHVYIRAVLLIFTILLKLTLVVGMSVVFDVERSSKDKTEERKSKKEMHLGQT